MLLRLWLPWNGFDWCHQLWNLDFLTWLVHQLGDLLEHLAHLVEVLVEPLEMLGHPARFLFVDAVGDHHLKVLAPHDHHIVCRHLKRTMDGIILISMDCKLYLTNCKALLVMDDLKVFFDSPGLQVFVGARFELEGIVLEVLDAVLKESFISGIDRLNSLLDNTMNIFFDQV